MSNYVLIRGAFHFSLPGGVSKTSFINIALDYLGII
jgi:hypothetical protein